MATFPTNILPLFSVLLLFGALVFVAAAEDPLLSAYEKWMSEFGRVYGSDTEKQHRFEVFKTNFQFIESMNKQPALTYTLGLNEFADLTNEEFVKKYVGFKSPSGPKKATPFKYANLTAAPTCVDWRSSSAVTPVKDQGNCGESKLELNFMRLSCFYRITLLIQNCESEIMTTTRLCKME